MKRAITIVFSFLALLGFVIPAPVEARDRHGHDNRSSWVKTRDCVLHGDCGRYQYPPIYAPAYPVYYPPAYPVYVPPVIVTRPVYPVFIEEPPAPVYIERPQPPEKQCTVTFPDGRTVRGPCSALAPAATVRSVPQAEELSPK